MGHHLRAPRDYRPACVLAVLIIAGWLLPETTYTTTPIVWVEPNLVRVGKYDSPGRSSQATLWAARGEYEPFQVVIRGPFQELTNIKISVSDLLGPKSAIISKSNIELFREHYVYVSRGSEDLGGSNRPLGRGWYADGLIPFAHLESDGLVGQSTLKATPFDLSAGRNQPIWVDVYVPRETTPGLYRGALTVSSDQGHTVVPIHLYVWNFELPLRPSLQTAFPIYNDNISRPPIDYAGVKANQEMLLRHKIMPVPVNPSDEREFIDNLGLNVASLAYYKYATWGNCNQPPAPSKAELQSQRARHQPDLFVYLQIADEVSDCKDIFPVLRQWAGNAHSAGVFTLLTAVPVNALTDDSSGSGRSVADIWVLLPKQFVSNAEDVEAAVHKGDRIWSYTALVQDSYSPKWAIDFDPINYRIQGGFLNQALGVKGLLYWAVNSWVLKDHADPWNAVQNLGPGSSFPPGEGMLVYPGDKIGLPAFAPSMRLKWIRESVDDYEYVETLKRLGREDWALRVVRSVASDWKHWTRDPTALEATRRQLGEEIDRLSQATTKHH